MTRIHQILLSKLTICLILTPAVGWGQDSDKSKTIEPPDVFVAVELLSDEVDLIRFVMGKPENKQTEIDVRQAAPREVYFQALTMFRKADRLSFEHTRTHSAASALPADEIQAADVFKVVEETLACVRRVKKKLAIEQQAVRPARDATKTPNDVFRAAVQVNRQLNLLLEQKFSPSDVFQQVTLGIGYTSRLLESFPDASSIPDEPALELGKRPADVYRRIVENFGRIRVIAESSGLTMLELKIDEQKINSAEPSDVYDVASLLVSELTYLHSQLPNTKPPRDVYFVGRKFPSHVFQRAGILEQQLIDLEKRVKQDANWLSK